MNIELEMSEDGHNVEALIASGLGEGLFAWKINRLDRMSRNDPAMPDADGSDIVCPTTEAESL